MPDDVLQINVAGAVRAGAERARLALEVDGDTLQNQCPLRVVLDETVRPYREVREYTFDTDHRSRAVREPEQRGGLFQQVAGRH